MSYLLQSFFFKLLGSLLSLQPLPLQSLPLLLFLSNTDDVIHFSLTTVIRSWWYGTELCTDKTVAYDHNNIMIRFSAVYSSRCTIMSSYLFESLLRFESPLLFLALATLLVNDRHTPITTKINNKIFKPTSSSLCLFLSSSFLFLSSSRSLLSSSSRLSLSVSSTYTNNT